MEEGRPGDVGDGRADLLPGMDHVHTERVHGVPSYIIAVHPRDQDFALVIVHE